MNNPVQTYTNAATASSVSVPFATRPSIGNRLIVAVYDWIPYSRAASFKVSDTSGNNTFAKIASQSILTPSGAYESNAIYSAAVVSNAGSPFSITVGMLVAPGAGGASPYIAACCFECANLSGSQPDVSPTSYQQPSGGTPLVVPLQNPTQTNDFGVAVMTVDGAASWRTPTSWTTCLSNPSDSYHPVNGEIDCIQLASNNPVEPVWTTISPSTSINQGLFVLFRGAPTSTTFSAPLSSCGPRVLPPSFAATLPLAASVAPPPCGVLPPQFQSRSWWIVPPAAHAGVIPPSFINSGTASLVAVPGALMCGVLPAKFSFSGPGIQIKRGPLSALASMTLLEGELYEAGIVQGSTTYTILFVGGHDGQAKLIGGGAQTVSGAPSWTTSQNGVILWDTSNKVFYVSSGGSWTTIS